MVISQLFETGCIKVGDFKLKSNLRSPYYIDLRGITRNRALYNSIVDEVKRRILASSDRKIDATSKIAIVGVPYGVVPLAAFIAYSLGLEYEPIRKETKNYGAEPEVADSDDYEYIVIEDVMSTGSSIIETINKMPGKKVTDIIVIVNRELGGIENLNSKYPDIKLHSILSIKDLLPHFEQKSQEQVK